MDGFYIKVLDESHNYLYKVVKLCLILSYGKSRVENGFTINSEIIKSNLKESSLASQSIIFEGIMKEGGSMEINITNKMIDYVRRSPTIY